MALIKYGTRRRTQGSGRKGERDKGLKDRRCEVERVRR